MFKRIQFFLKMVFSFTKITKVFVKITRSWFKPQLCNSEDIFQPKQQFLFDKNLFFFLPVISRVGREVAPYLKSMASTWHISCCDPHIPASTLALKAFSTAFNGDEIKHREAIFFAQNEVLTNISDNLLVLTPSTLSDPK